MAVAVKFEKLRDSRAGHPHRPGDKRPFVYSLTYILRSPETRLRFATRQTETGLVQNSFFIRTTKIVQSTNELFGKNRNFGTPTSTGTNDHNH